MTVLVMFHTSTFNDFINLVNIKSLMTNLRLINHYIIKDWYNRVHMFTTKILLSLLIGAKGFFNNFFNTFSFVYCNVVTVNGTSSVKIL